MKITRLLTLSILLVFPAAAVAQGQAKEADKQATAKAPRQYPDSEVKDTDSPLVRAAKQARAAKKPGAVVIDNDDVKKSKGSLIVMTQKPINPELIKPSDTAPNPKKAPVAELLKFVNEKVEKAQKDVADLEKELARLEDEYYNEDDPNYRGDVIEQRFNQATKQLERARQSLLDAREDQQRLQSQASTRRSDQ